MNLKPCPFCGGTAAFRWCGGVMLAECTSCFTSKGDGNASEDFEAAAAANWNARAYTSAPTEEAAPQDDVPLRCEVVNGAIEFIIGAKILAHATNIAPNLYDAENDRGLYRVTDPTVFAKAVERELNRESEDGSTPLTMLLDKMVEEAINQGAEGVEEHGDGGPEQP